MAVRGLVPGVGQCTVAGSERRARGDAVRMEMKGVTDPAALLMRRLQRLLKWRLWIQERLQPSEWQVTLLWAAVAGVLGAISALLFTTLTERVHDWIG